MTQVDFAANRKSAEDAGMLGNGGDYYKYKEGDNRLRLMSECLPHEGSYKGKRNFKWLCYVLDRRDGKLKVHFMPHKVYKAIEALQQDPDYTFQTVPMPYDIRVTAKGAGTKEVEYSVIPVKKETPLTDEETEALDAAKALREIQDAIYEKAEKAAKDEPSGDQRSAHDHDDAPMEPITDDDIPFAWLMPLVLPMAGLLGLGLLA